MVSRVNKKGRRDARPRRCRVEIDTSRLKGVAADLVVRPFQWKGSEPTIRSFNRGAAHNELGMQAVEIVGYGVDVDVDGVADEMTIGDQTALAVYLAAQPRPTSRTELAQLGLIEPLTPEESASIETGRRLFEEIGCESCHRSALLIDHPIFSEPSQQASHRDETFPAGQDPTAELVDPAYAVTFDLTRDQPDNVIELPDGTEVRLGSFRSDARGRAIVELYGDLKMHEMGPGLAESIDETGSGASS